MTFPDTATAQAAPAGWWAAGDFPVREGCRVRPLIDGRMAMLMMCLAFLTARRYILLAGWDLRADLDLVRGEDRRVGADDSAQQRALLERLRAEGFDDDALRFWTTAPLRVADVLGFAARRGVRVGVLLWDAFHMGSHLTNDPARERAQLMQAGVECLLDDSSRHITHLTQSLHQKCCVVDGRVAFVGGIDLTCQMGGDYDRWDVHAHPCASPDRSTEPAAPAHPWHDLHTRIEGPAVADVLRNIAQRWDAVATRHHLPNWPAALTTEPAPAPLADGTPAQVLRTIPPDTYGFAPRGISTIKDAYLAAIAHAERAIYIENQYLWPEEFLGLDRLRWGERSPDSMAVIAALGDALARGVAVAIVLPDHPNCGRRFSDGGLALLRARAGAAGAATRLHAFTLGSAEEAPSAPGGVRYRPVYVHAKVAIVDDRWWTAGSANLNSRGMRTDAEINIASYHPATARTLRVALWEEHLRLDPSRVVELADAASGLALLDASARANLARVGQRRMMDGHLLPYLAADQATALGLPVHADHGWLDSLPGGAGALPERYAHRYL